MTLVSHPTSLGSMVLNPDRMSDIICELEFFPLATDEEIEPDDLCPMKTPRVIEETSEDNETGVDMEHHWKNRINDTVRRTHTRHLMGQKNCGQVTNQGGGHGAINPTNAHHSQQMP